MFQRFTEGARRVVVFAQEEARGLKHNYVGTEHLLLGLLREENGVAARALDGFDVTVEEVRAQVARIVGPGDEVIVGQIPFTPRAKKVLELAMREALSSEHDYIGTEHILLGIAKENEGVAARILFDFDVDAEAIRLEVARLLRRGGTAGPRAASGMGPRSAQEISIEIPPAASTSTPPGAVAGSSEVAARLAALALMLAGAAIFAAGLLVGFLIWG